MVGLLKAVLLPLLLSLFSFAARATPNTPAGEELRWDLSSRPAVAILLPGMSHHFQSPANTTRKWNETHDGIGLETRSKWNEADWYFKTAIGLMRDSVDSWGAYGGAVWQKRVFDGESWVVDAGGGVFLFYRALHFDGNRMWLPGALPVLSLEHKNTGIGLNILYVPHFKTDAGEMPAVLFAQLTKRF
jgi:hypothetical protein